MSEQEQKQKEKGVCYFSKIPPYMNPMTLRKLLTQRFEIERIYLEPEPDQVRIQRKKSGGNHKIKYVEGWVEFADKQEAKVAALALNNSQIGGKKRHNLFYDDLWTIKYLPKFKWSHLTEKLAYDQKVREQRMKAETNKAKKELNFFMEKVDLKKKLDKMEEKKMKKFNKIQGGDGEMINDKEENENEPDVIEENDNDNETQNVIAKKKQKNLLKMMKYHQRKRRVFKQREPVIQQ